MMFTTTTMIAATPEVVDAVVNGEDGVVGTTNLAIQRISLTTAPIRMTIIMATVTMTTIIVIIITKIQVDGLVDSMEDIIIIMTRVDGVGVDSMVEVVDIIAMLVEVVIIEKNHLRRDFQNVCWFAAPMRL